ncbi:murein hydrolase activator EnvC family protein [Desulfitobacterium hafniense]|uniref:murein hydrolase activator EnvC family protein n=1 Tax=Desulfitobacterium hafniense TaxID=49338 RepID=UPI0003718A8B|nr:peptidoglycan DD-metalloendopeptidase family protein [Desulfitobacterium hafniense]
MNPYERWDDWEWERAAQEVGRERGFNYEERPRKRPYTRKKKPLGPLYQWTGLQKKAALSVTFFLMVFFASKGEDMLSQGIYTAYQGTVQSSNYYASLNDMALQVLGMSIENKSTAVDATMQGKFIPPVSGKVMAGFGGAGEGQAGLHNGIDVASALGIPVVAPYQGVVTHVGEDPQLGRVVKLDFGNGWTGVLGNFGDIAVAEGQRVDSGQVLGSVGLSAPLKKTWLHIELRKDGVPVDPLPYLVPAN